MNPPEHAVTWIRVERPTFDLVGVLVSSFEITGVLLLAAVGLGGLLGMSLIYHRRRSGPPTLDAVSLRLH
ncbi:MAG TPA: hypothetical protein VLI67_11615 [Vicinamibacteria bacterium]|nr:hypothetical protein [Vicinamibacteria bacterium]